MDQVNQENELQKAIDDITRNNGATPADATAELEAKIQDQMGTPPVPPMPPVGEGPAETMPPENAPVAEPTPENVAEGAAPDLSAGAPIEPAGPVVPVSEEAPAIVGSGGEVGAPTDLGAAAETPAATETTGGDINAVKEAMLRDLFPLMDKVEMGAEEKFELYKSMIDSTNDKSMIAAAYEAAKGIGDETRKAEALLFLIKKADA